MAGEKRKNRQRRTPKSDVPKHGDAAAVAKLGLGDPGNSFELRGLNYGADGLLELVKRIPPKKP